MNAQLPGCFGTVLSSAQHNLPVPSSIVVLLFDSTVLLESFPGAQTQLPISLMIST